MKSSERLWRTLVRVESVDERKGRVYVVIPGWDINQRIRIDLKDIPKDMHRQLQPDFRCHAQVNIGVHKGGDLKFSKWEIDYIAPENKEIK